MNFRETCATNLSQKINNFRLSHAFLVKQFIKTLAEIFVDELIPIQRFVMIIITS